MSKVRGLALLKEIADVLSGHGSLPCTPYVDDVDGLVTLTVTLRAGDVQQGMEALEVRGEFERVSDVAQMRGFAEHYGIAPSELERVLDTPRTVSAAGFLDELRQFVGVRRDRLASGPERSGEGEPDAGRR